jgi:RNA polymerase sigma factor (sigma-70 family)
MELLCEGASTVFSEWTIDQVIARAKGEDLPSAWAELERRSRSWRVPFVTWLARRCSLPDAEIADVQERAILAIPEAARKYDLSRGSDLDPWRWKKFLKKVIFGRVSNYVRDYRRVERGLDRLRQAEEIIREEGGRGQQFGEQDPARIAARAEAEARLRQAVQRLEELDRRIVEGLMEEMPEVRIAEKLGITRGQIRGRISRIREWLRPYLQDLQDVLE